MFTFISWEEILSYQAELRTVSHKTIISLYQNQALAWVKKSVLESTKFPLFMWILRADENN